MENSNLWLAAFRANYQFKWGSPSQPDRRGTDQNFQIWVCTPSLFYYVCKHLETKSFGPNFFRLVVIEEISYEV